MSCVSTPMLTLLYSAPTGWASVSYIPYDPLLAGFLLGLCSANRRLMSDQRIERK